MWNPQTGRGDEELRWNEATDRWELADGTVYAEPPKGVNAFELAFARIVLAMVDSHPRYQIAEIAIEVRAATWAKARAERTPAPIRLCDYMAGSKRKLFWLLLPEESS